MSEQKQNELSKEQQELLDKLNRKKQELLTAYYEKHHNHDDNGLQLYYTEGINAAINQIVSGKKDTEDYLFAQVKKGKFGNFKDYTEYKKAFDIFHDGFTAISCEDSSKS